MNDLKAIFGLLIIAPFYGYSQLKITNISWSESAITPSSIAQVSIHAENCIGQVVEIHTTISDETGEDVLEICSVPISIANGSCTLSPKRFTSIRYAEGCVGNYVQSLNALPFGEYIFCTEIVSTSKEVLDKYCETIISSRSELMTLDYPTNSDSLHTLNPNFIWFNYGYFSYKCDRYYRIVLSELNDGQSPLEALEMNELIWVSNKLSSYNLVYPSSASPLKEGHSYVWQVQLLNESRVIAFSKPESFSIGKLLLKDNLEYINLNSAKIDTVILENNILKIRYDESINNSEISVLAASSRNIKETYTVPYELKIVQTSQGKFAHLITVDFSELPCQNGGYELKIRSGSNFIYSLNVIRK